MESKAMENVRADVMSTVLVPREEYEALLESSIRLRVLTDAVFNSLGWSPYGRKPHVADDDELLAVVKVLTSARYAAKVAALEHGYKEQHTEETSEVENE